MSRQIAGWKVDTEEREELLRRFPPRYAETVADHVTLCFGTDADTPLPTAKSGEIVGEANDGTGVQALVVRRDDRAGRQQPVSYHLVSGAGARSPRKQRRDPGSWLEADRGARAVRLLPARWSG